jgi:hypothetical protein
MPTGRSAPVGALRTAPSRPTGPGARCTHGDRSGGGEAATWPRRSPVRRGAGTVERARGRIASAMGPGTEPRAEQTRHGEQRGASASPPAGTRWWRRPAGSTGSPRRRVRCPAARRCGGARAPSPPARPASRRLPYAARSAPISALAATGPAPPTGTTGAHRPGRSCAPAVRRRTAGGARTHRRSPRSPTRPRPVRDGRTRRRHRPLREAGGDDEAQQPQAVRVR